jgi:hypothetical protein
LKQHITYIYISICISIFHKNTHPIAHSILTLPFLSFQDKPREWAARRSALRYSNIADLKNRYNPNGENSATAANSNSRLNIPSRSTSMMDFPATIGGTSTTATTTTTNNNNNITTIITPHSPTTDSVRSSSLMLSQKQTSNNNTNSNPIPAKSNNWSPVVPSSDPKNPRSSLIGVTSAPASIPTTTTTLSTEDNTSNANNTSLPPTTATPTTPTALTTPGAPPETGGVRKFALMRQTSGVRNTVTAAGVAVPIAPSPTAAITMGKRVSVMGVTPPSNTPVNNNNNTTNITPSTTSTSTTTGDSRRISFGGHRSSSVSIHAPSLTPTPTTSNSNNNTNTNNTTATPDTNNKNETKSTIDATNTTSTINTSNNNNNNNDPGASSLKRELKRSVSTTSWMIITASGLPPGWEEVRTRDNEKLYLDHRHSYVTLTHPTKGRNGRGSETMRLLAEKEANMDIENNQVIQRATKVEEKVLVKAQTAIRCYLARLHLRALKKFAETREKIAKEVLAEEYQYLKSLERVVKDYIRPSREKNLWGDNSKAQQVMFRKVESLLDNSQILYELFEKRIGGGRWQQSTSLGDVYGRLIPALPMYLVFTESHQKSLVEMQNKSLTSLFAKLSKKTDTKNVLALALDLPDLLTRPLQHLPKSREILEEFIKVTWKSSRDYPALREALGHVRETSEKMRLMIDNQKNTDQIMRIQRMWTGNPSPPDLRGKLFAREGYLIKLCKRSMKRRWFVLFADSIMYGDREDPKGKIKFVRWIPFFSRNSLKEIPDDPQLRR